MLKCHFKLSDRHEAVAIGYLLGIKRKRIVRNPSFRQERSADPKNRPGTSNDLLATTTTTDAEDVINAVGSRAGGPPPRLSQDDRRRGAFHGGAESVVKIYGRPDAVPGL